MIKGISKSKINSFLDFFLPRFCPSCFIKLNPCENIICPACKSNIKKAEASFIKAEYERKFESDGIIKEFLPLYIFEKDRPLQYLLHSLKYEKRFLIGKFLGNEMALNLREKISRWQISCIVPVPLSKVRKADRGFNQSYFIAAGISNVLNIPIAGKLVRRVKYTESQTKLSLSERQKNIRQAFKIDCSKIREGMKVLLVDDVITTGATISECARELDKAGIGSIYAVSVAIADI